MTILQAETKNEEQNQTKKPSDLSHEVYAWFPKDISQMSKTKYYNKEDR